MTDKRTTGRETPAAPALAPRCGETENDRMLALARSVVACFHAGHTDKCVVQAYDLARRVARVLSANQNH